MDVYRRLTRCTSIDMLNLLEADLKDAFGEAPRQATLLLALTELRLLSGHWGIESIIRKEPDVVLTVRDAMKALTALAGAPGTIRVIDDKTVYLRMPGSFLEPDTLLMTLKNLMRQAYDREQKGETLVTPDAAARSEKQPLAAGKKKVASAREPEPTLAHPQLENLKSLRDQGVLTEQQFQDAKKRLLARAAVD
jgi:transcription-repair coupling factor (superfamily II helicase)